MVGAFNTPSLAIDRTVRQKIRKNLGEMTNTINQWDLIDTYR